MNYIVGVDKITNSSDSENIAVATTSVVYTKAIKLRYAIAFSLKIKATSSSGTADIKVEIEEATDLPTTEGSSDTSYVVPDSMSAIYTSLSDELVHIKQITPVCAPYMRLKITGNASNPADTIVNASIITQQPV